MDTTHPKNTEPESSMKDKVDSKLREAEERVAKLKREVDRLTEENCEFKAAWYRRERPPNNGFYKSPDTMLLQDRSDEMEEQLQDYECRFADLEKKVGGLEKMVEFYEGRLSSVQNDLFRMIGGDADKKIIAENYASGIDKAIDFFFRTHRLNNSLFDTCKLSNSSQLNISRDIARSIRALSNSKYPAKRIIALINRFTLGLIKKKNLRNQNHYRPSWYHIFGQLERDFLNVAIRWWLESGKDLLFSTSLRMQTTGKSPGVFEDSDEWHVRMFKPRPIFTRSLCFMSDATTLGLIRYAPTLLENKLPPEVVEIIQDHLAPPPYTAKEFTEKFGNLETIYRVCPSSPEDRARRCSINRCNDNYIAHHQYRTCSHSSPHLWSNEKRRFVRAHDGKLCKLEKCRLDHPIDQQSQGDSLSPFRYDNKTHPHKQVMRPEMLFLNRFSELSCYIRAIDYEHLDTNPWETHDAHPWEARVLLPQHEDP